MTKPCGLCGVIKSQESFYVRKDGTLSIRCMDCIERKEVETERRRIRRHQLLEESNHTCAECGEPIPDVEYPHDLSPTLANNTTVVHRACYFASRNKTKDAASMDHREVLNRLVRQGGACKKCHRIIAQVTKAVVKDSGVYHAGCAKPKKRRKRRGRYLRYRSQVRAESES